MIKIPIVQYPNDILRKELEPIKDIDQNVRDCVWQISRRLPFCQGFGLAAPQIGIELPVFGYIDLENRRHKFFINPVIKEYSDDMFMYEEGCLSIPGFYFPVERPNTILIEALDKDGEKFEVEASGLLGRIFQHEVDHLNGKLVIDLLSEDQLKYFEVQQMALASYRKVSSGKSKPKPKKKRK
jgi:peptide deformylase